MTNKEFFNKELPKWPAFLVIGKPVTKEQAMEILIRTDELWFSSNDHEFDQQLNEYFYDVKIPKGYLNTYDEAIAKKLCINKEDGERWTKIREYETLKNQEVGQINLEYLKNSRIVSSWFGGPHGWCDWEGNIGTYNYNIGKYPSVENVYREWERIAKEFPFLELTCQLMNHEANCAETVDNPSIVIEFRVKNGKVKMYEPKEKIIKDSFSHESMFEERFTNPHAERGCDIKKFKEAVEFVRNKFKK